jgi:hypothetical protein
METKMKPDPQVMENFLLHLFGNQTRGMVELAWRDANDGKVRHAELFHLDNLDELIARAVEVNSIEGQSTYFSASLRKPETAPFGRASDSDVLCAPAFWADLDDAEAVANARKHSGKAPPNIAVITGRHPHPRAQLYWVQEEAVTDLDMVRRQNAALAAVLGGDRAVVNCGRIMRLPGSIAWPAKPGRIVEMTELRTWTDRAPAYVEGEVATAFPLDAARPKKLSEVLATGSAPEHWIEILQNGAAEGTRNTTAVALAGHLLRRDVQVDVAREILRLWNANRCAPPLAEDELIAAFNSICARDLSRRAAA